MTNYWQAIRQKRLLNLIREVLATFSETSLDQEWQGQRIAHLSEIRNTFSIDRQILQSDL